MRGCISFILINEVIVYKEMGFFVLWESSSLLFVCVDDEEKVEKRYLKL